MAKTKAQRLQRTHREPVERPVYEVLVLHFAADGGQMSPSCPVCNTWTPGDANGDGTVVVCRVCAARGRIVRLNTPPRRLHPVERAL